MLKLGIKFSALLATPQSDDSFSHFGAFEARPTAMISRQDHALLPALDALLAERSVTRAAKRLNLSQPAMSAILQRLRELLEDPILVQVGREQFLSPRAAAMASPLHQALLAVSSAVASQPF
ncbi:LysR family transcriptional regulator, partial [Sphingomonas sp.]|uniref:helix-turn-helix domain-containing protein n=1 Tax=Sphingomonas sp. TaxID=28214 RepID=UPI0025D8B4DD